MIYAAFAPQPRARRRARPLLLALVLALAAGCSGPSMAPVQADPGIAATLAVVRGQSETLFAELERNPYVAFSEADPIHYRPLLGELAKAQRLATLHERAQTERQALAALEGTVQELRGLHRENRVVITNLAEYRARIGAQIDALLRMEGQ